MGLIAMWEGDYETAAAEFHSALVVTEARLGTDHPQTARLEGKLAEALSWREHDAESERLFRKAASVLMRELGARHPWVVALRLQRAQVLVQTGELDDAEAELGEVMALGSDAAAHGLLGHIFAERRRLPEAEAQYRAAASRFAASRGPQHPNTLGARASVAQMLFAQERYGEAVQVYDEVFPDLEQALGPDHPEVVKLKVYFLLSEQARGRFAQTQAPLEHVVVRCSEPKQIDPLSCMTAASLLARAVLETAGDVNRARHLAEFADASVAGVPHVPPDHRKYLDAVWEAVKRAEATTSRRAPTKAASPR
jgi:tetratricopeptide (TPR) repeat protein